MQGILLASAGHYFFGFLLFFIAVFLIGLILLQRGRGGGLTGALGGAGGQSAFGSKTGDVFTRITIIAATVWILACLTAVKVLTNPTSSVFASGGAGPTVESGSKGGDKSGADKTGSDKGGADKSGGAAGGAGADAEPESSDGAQDGGATEGGAKGESPKTDGEAPADAEKSGEADSKP